MNIIAVDDEKASLWMLENAITKAAGQATVSCFLCPDEALQYAQNNQVNIAFLDIEMGETNGLFLAKRLKEICHTTNIIFVTGYSSFMGAAFDLRVSGYVLKPIAADKVAEELEHLRHPVINEDDRLRVQCFGNFEVFAGNMPVSFRRSKSKEVLAYLVDRKGAGVSNKELAAILWEDSTYSRTTQSHLRTILIEMMRALKEAGAGDVVIRQYNSHAIDTTKVNCDYYQFLAGNISSINAYRGEYMTNYSWAEFTLSLLSKTALVQF